MKKKIFIILLLILCFSVNFNLNTVSADTNIVNTNFYTIDKTQNEQDNVYNGTSLSDNGFLLTISRSTGNVVLVPNMSRTIEYNYPINQNFTYIQYIYLNDYGITCQFFTIVNDSFQFAIAQNPYIKLTSVFNVNRSGSVDFIKLQSFKYEVFTINTIGGNPTNITNNHKMIVRGNSVLSNGINYSAFRLELYPSDLFLNNIDVSYVQLLKPYKIRLNYNLPKNDLYYLNTTGGFLGLSTPFYNSEFYASPNVSCYVNFYSSYIAEDGTLSEVSAFDNSQFKDPLSSQFVLFDWKLVNNYNYKDYYTYDFMFILSLDNIRVNNTNLSTIAGLNYFDVYIPDSSNSLYGGFSTDAYNGGLIDLYNNKYYKEITNPFDVFGHLYNFFIFLIFDMPLISDIIKFFNIIIQIVYNIFEFIISFTFDNVIILSFVGLFFLIFILRFLL